MHECLFTLILIIVYISEMAVHTELILMPRMHECWTFVKNRCELLLFENTDTANESLIYIHGVQFF